MAYLISFIKREKLPKKLRSSFRKVCIVKGCIGRGQNIKFIFHECLNNLYIHFHTRRLNFRLVLLILS